MENNINLNQFLGKVNAYKFDFLEKSITGKLIEISGNYLRIQTKTGNEIVAHVDSLVSVWHIYPKEKAV